MPEKLLEAKEPIASENTNGLMSFSDKKKLDRIGKIPGMDLLWENENPKSSSGFTETTINLDLNNYNYLMILSIDSNTSPMIINPSIIPINNQHGITQGNILGTPTLNRIRQYTVYSDKIVFGSGYSAGGVSNTTCVPICIIGLRIN